MDLETVDRITTDAIGEPGHRVFYLQMRAGATLVTLLVEKEQIVALSQAIFDVIRRAGVDAGKPAAEELMALEEPIEPRWRAGRLALGFDTATQEFMLEAEERIDEDDEDDDGGETADDPGGLGGEFASDIGGALGDVDPEAETITLRGTPHQMLSLAHRAVLVAARGRPRCPMCGNPTNPDGSHWCPGRNGHRPSAEGLSPEE